MLKKILFFLFAFCCITINAQNVKVSGEVVDKDNEPLIGATVNIKGTNTSTMTDLDGKFTIDAQNGQTLVVKMVGMTTQEVVCNGQPIRVVMDTDAKILDEVVVIGYQTIRKADLTGAVSVFNPDMMKNKTVTGTVGDALGSLPGITVRTSGAPGSEGKVVIRGASTFGNGDPLYVVDGVVSGANRDFNYHDIESVQVLKDASAAAIYGSRAANGVVIITTKGGKEGPMRIEASAQLTAQWLPKYKLVDRDRWIELNDLAFTNAGKPKANHYDNNTDWQKEVFKTGLIQDYNISFSGGSKNANYFISGNMQDNSGTTIGTDSRRFTLRSNTSATKELGSKLKFRIGENIILSNYKVDELNTNPIIDVYTMLPTIPIYDPANEADGGYGYGDINRDITYGVNPVARENVEQTINQNLRVRGNLFSELAFNNMLKYKFNLGFDFSNDAYKYIYKGGKYRYNQPTDPTSLNKFQAQSGNMVYDNTLEFNHKFNDHNISAVAGISYQDQYYDRISGTKTHLVENGVNSFYEQFDAGGNISKLEGFRKANKLYSLFSRINYNFSDKYLFSFTIRRDESSKFAPGKRVGYFPSVSLGWRISQEKFFNTSFIDDLKIRANYGSLGNSNIEDWDWMALMNFKPQIVMGDDVLLPGMTQTKLAYPNLTWEKQTQINAGFDLTILQNRFQISTDVFQKKGKDLLVELFIPMSLGSNAAPRVNGATVNNTGVDVSLMWRDKAGDFAYNVGLNASYLKNEVVYLGYNTNSFTSELTKTVVGGSIGDWYLIKTDGIFKTDAEAAAYVDKDGKPIRIGGKTTVQAGDVRYIDNNGDGEINDADRQFCGSSTPKFQLGLNFGLEYKGFDLQAQLAGAFGHKLYNGPRQTMDRFDDNFTYHIDYEPWTPQNPNAKDPRPIYGDGHNILKYQDRWLEKGDYLRLSQLALGYSVPKSVVGNDVRVRLFTNLQNILTLTSYTGLDPEFLNGDIFNRGNDYGAFPNPKGFTVGAQISF